MKRILIVLLLLAAPVLAQDSWTGPDKRLHLFASGIAGFIAIDRLPNEPFAAWGWAMLPGLIKELSDPRFSGKDLVVDGIGAYLGVRLGHCRLTPGFAVCFWQF